MIALSRRDFLKATSVLTAGYTAEKTHLTGMFSKKNRAWPICVFTKCLQFLENDVLADTIAGVGFEGADIPVRKNGQVLPGEVETALPRIVKALRRAGIKVPMIATDINTPDYPDIERILGTASSLGITHYRMGYLLYDPGMSVIENLDLHKKTMESLEKVNRKYQIHGAYQNHSGKMVGSSVWDIYWILKNCDPAYVGCQYDIRHATCEGGNSWSVGMNLIAPWIKCTDMKDFVWEKNGETWMEQNVPLGEGQVDFDAYMKNYNRLKIEGPVSVHYEYDLGGAEHGKLNPTMSLEEITHHLKRDLTWLKAKFKQHQII